MGKYAIGLDYGTLSVRALLLNAETGREEATAVYVYPHAVMDRSLPESDEQFPDGWALQDPRDYFDGLCETVRGVMLRSGISPDEVIGIGVDCTASTMMPVRRDGTPLCACTEFCREPQAYLKLWKHHGAEKEAAVIERVAKARDEKWLSSCGDKVSSEWMVPKMLETLHTAPAVYAQADRFIEVLDWLIWQMTGTETRSACGTGYKAFWNDEDGYPSEAFFAELDPDFADVARDKLYAPVLNIGDTAGRLCASMAEKMGMAEGTPVGTGIIDAHASLVGAGICSPGTMMVTVGTSSCHMALFEKMAPLKGVNGIVKNGVIPGYYAYEAGQSCVGDGFDWFVRSCVPERYVNEAKERGIGIHALLLEKAKDIRPGQSGLLALDWFNGVRTPLMDYDLSGLILGLNLHTKPEEIYLALIEATAFGTRMIIDDFERNALPIRRIILGGGIPAKNRRLVQIYADVFGCEVQISDAAQVCARGAAILGIAAADPAVSGYDSLQKIVETFGQCSGETVRPIAENHRVYDRLYAEYEQLHQYFGRGGNDVMKRLKRLQSETSAESFCV